MATCDMGYEHDEPVPAEPEPVVVNPGPNENDVRIAEIEAAARIETEKMFTEQRGLELTAEVESLRGELRGMRAVLDRVAPPEPEPPAEPPAPAPVVVEDNDDDGTPPPPETEKKKPPSNSGGGWWAGYSG